MSGHGHSHGCGGSDDHDHITEAEKAAAYSLFLKIDTERVECLNEAVDGSGKDVFKPWDKRLDKEKFVESDADEELLFNIPFTGSVKLKGIIVIGGEEDTHPNLMRIYKNRPNMTFDTCGAEPDQMFELHPDPTGALEYSTKVARFNSVEHLSIHFPTNFGADNTKVYYIGLRGDFTEVHRHEVTICNYEARANPADHKTNILDSVNQQIS
ncbi:PITH domain-containing protein 1-like [Ylistrum balloti]|uniref:PITH domain-containing protein 1-like n=1 Tax=Ylistrum balloti TaxID=509963 RepID=UPI002905A602|nr:PITH domain-containing protein 1-like [Ylistrum balloti]